MNTQTSLSAHMAEVSGGRNVVTVASGKGGVGKTWFAITLAHAMARGGRRVLLFDGDLGLANVDIQLGLSVDHDLGDVFAGRTALADTVTPYGDGGFDIIAGRSGSGSLALLPPERIVGVRQQMFDLATRYDTAIIDLGAGIDQPVRLLSASAGICLVVTSDEPTSLTDAYAFIKVNHAAAPGADVRVVVNLCESRIHGEQTYATLAKACRNFLGITPPLAGVIRRDPRVRESIRNQMPLLGRFPNCEVAGDVANIAKNLTPRE